MPAGQFYQALLASARSTVTIGILIAGALIFQYVITREYVPNALPEWLTRFERSKVGLLIRDLRPVPGAGLHPGKRGDPVDHRADRHSDGAKPGVDLFHFDHTVGLTLDSFHTFARRIDPAAIRRIPGDKLRAGILGTFCCGTRQVNLKGGRDIWTPADMAGVKRRMPAGESWQFLGKALGANRVPIPYTELCTAVQSGVVDGQDNPRPSDKTMKFHDVTDQIALTDHNVGFGMPVILARL
uniref:TRAP transporter large permease subunit n=1 Tax=Chachezhania sediminis TaxID=2599291 RepID=UPI00389938E0